MIFPDGTRLTADVADTHETRARGLMFRESLGESEGMLFVFDAPRRYAFWMKHVRIPLDILWLDAAGRVVWIVEGAPPCLADPCPTYAPGASASRVLETAAGFARRHGVALGDTVSISRPR